MNEGNPKRIVYAFTLIAAAVLFALLFAMFNAVLSSNVGRAVVSIVLAALLTAPAASVIQDAIVYRK